MLFSINPCATSPQRGGPLPRRGRAFSRRDSTLIPSSEEAAAAKDETRQTKVIADAGTTSSPPNPFLPVESSTGGDSEVSSLSDLTWSEAGFGFDDDILVQDVIAGLDMTTTEAFLATDTSDQILQKAVDEFYRRYTAKQRTDKLRAVMARDSGKHNDPGDFFIFFVLVTSLAASLLCFVVPYSEPDFLNYQRSIYANTPISHAVRSPFFYQSLFFTVGASAPLFFQNVTSTVFASIRKGSQPGLSLYSSFRLLCRPRLSFRLIRSLTLLIILLPALFMLLVDPAIYCQEAFYVVSTFWQASAIAGVYAAYGVNTVSTVLPTWFLIALFHLFNACNVVQVWAQISHDFENRNVPASVLQVAESIMYVYGVVNFYRGIRRGAFASATDGQSMTRSTILNIVLNIIFVVILACSYIMNASIRTTDMSQINSLICSFFVYVKTFSVIFLAVVSTSIVLTDLMRTKERFRKMLSEIAGTDTGTGTGLRGVSASGNAVSGANLLQAAAPLPLGEEDSNVMTVPLFTNPQASTNLNNLTGNSLWDAPRVAESVGGNQGSSAVATQALVVIREA